MKRFILKIAFPTHYGIHTHKAFVVTTIIKLIDSLQSHYKEEIKEVLLRNPLGDSMDQ